MDFTREPIIETVITPRDGHKLVIRSSKSAAQEEYFVDAVEIVSFGSSLFFRALERPKSFLLPVSDYEVLEVREARMVLKNVGLDRSIKIGGGREANVRQTREPALEKVAAVESEVAEEKEETTEDAAQPAAEQRQEGRFDKKRDRRRNYRRRRGSRDEKDESKEDTNGEAKSEDADGEKNGSSEANAEGEKPTLTTLLPPPPTLISETIARYREEFKNAFYSKEEKQALEEEQIGTVEDLEFVHDVVQEEVVDEFVDEDPSHPVIQPEDPQTSSENGEESLWNFSEELSNNNNPDKT